MLKNRKIPDLFLGALLAFAIFAVGLSVGLSFYPPEKHQSAKNAEERGSSGGGDDRIADYTLVQTWLSFLLVVSTIGLWVQTKKSSRIAEQALVRLERPYIFNIDCTFIRAPVEILTDVAALNCGNVAGTVTEVNAQFFSNDDLPAIPPYSDGITRQLDMTAIPVAMATSERLDPRVLLGRFSTKDMNAKYLFGYFRYDGIIEKGHKTWFCYRLPTGSGVGTVAGGPTYCGYA